MDGDSEDRVTLITGARVLTCDRARTEVADGAVAIAGTRILAVGPTSRLVNDHPRARVIPASGKAVIPGFINSHTHAVLLVLRGTVEDMGGDAIFGYMTPISFAMLPDERAALARLACLEAIRCGTTTLVEVFRFLDGYADALVDSGLRLWLAENAADALIRKIRYGVYEHDRSFGREFLDRSTSLIERFHGRGDGRVRCQVAAHAPDVCSPWMLRELNDLAHRHGLRRTVHLAQSPGEVSQVRALRSATPAEYLRDHDWLGPDVVAAHWTWCTDSDIDLCARHGVHMVHCPANSSRLGPHRVRIGRILDAGINVVLGTDNMTEDMFHALKIGSIIHRRRRGGRPVGEVDPQPAAMLDTVTRNAARALGEDAELGTIEPGRKADLVIIDLDRAHLRPIISLASSLVHYGHPGAVNSVMVDGRFVMREGRLLTLDEQAVIREAQQAAEAAWHRLHRESGDIPLPPGIS